MKVLIVGAGPTGLTAAIELARRGIIPKVIDRKSEASTLSRAVGILPSSLKALGPSGVNERLVAEGVKVSGLHIFRGSDHSVYIALTGAHPDQDFGLLALPQDRTEKALRDALEGYGGSVDYNTEITAIRQSENSVCAVTSKGDEECDTLIGADGIHSTVRKSVGIAYPGFDLSETWSIADVDAKDWAHPNSLTLSLLPGGDVVVVVPLEARRYRVVSNTEDALATLPLKLDVLNRRRQGQFKISIRQAQSYGSGRVFLAGDAAHCHSPVGGRGMNLGIADATELARRLADRTVDGYSTSRHAAGAKVLQQSERLRKFVSAPDLFRRTLARLILEAVRNSPSLKRAVARRLLDG